MADMKQMDVAAGHAAVQAMGKQGESLRQMQATLSAAVESLAETWNGTSKTQFQGTWEEYLGQVRQASSTLEQMQANLGAEVRQVEEAFQA